MSKLQELQKKLEEKEKEFNEIKKELEERKDILQDIMYMQHAKQNVLIKSVDEFWNSLNNESVMNIMRAELIDIPVLDELIKEAENENNESKVKYAKYLKEYVLSKKNFIKMKEHFKTQYAEMIKGMEDMNFFRGGDKADQLHEECNHYMAKGSIISEEMGKLTEEIQKEDYESREIIPADHEVIIEE